MGKSALRGRGNRTTISNLVAAPTRGDTAPHPDIQAFLALWQPALQRSEYGYIYKEPGLKALALLQQAYDSTSARNQPEIRQLIDDEVAFLLQTEQDKASSGCRNYGLLDEPGPLLRQQYQQIMQQQKPIMATLTAAQQTAIDTYVGSGFRTINPACRHPELMTTAIQEHINALDEVFTQLPPTSAPLIVSRGIELDEAKEFHGNAQEIIARHQQPSSVEQSYLSTAAKMVHLGSRESSLNLLIEIPAGSKVLVPAAGPHWTMVEAEVLLPRGTRLDRISGSERDIHVRACTP